MPLLVYAVIRSSHPNRDAVVGEGIRVVQSDALAAVVRDMPEQAGLLDEDAVSYLGVLVSLLSGGPVIPVPLGMAALDERALRVEMLQADGADLEQRLDELEGLVEVRLTIDADPESEIEKLFQSWPGMTLATRPHGQSGPLGRELGRNLGTLLAERRDELSDRVIQRLATGAEAHAILVPDYVTEFRHAYLVCGDQLEHFDHSVQDVCSGLGDGYQVEYVGPLPAFDFADIRLRSEARRSRRGS